MFADWLRLPMPIDHVGYGARDLRRVIDLFRMLGFAPTEEKELVVWDAETGAFHPLGQLSAHVVFANGYIELSAPTGQVAGNHLIPLVERRPGIHILAIAADDAERRRASALALHPSLPEVSHAAREIAYGKRRGKARFKWFPLPREAFPEGIVCFAEHLTRDLVFQSEVLSHPNKASGLSGVALVSENPERTAARYRPFAQGEHGIPRVHDRCHLSVAAHADLSGRGFGLNIPGGDAMIGLEVETASLTALTNALDRNRVGFREGESGILIPLSAINSFMLFRERRPPPSPN